MKIHKEVILYEKKKMFEVFFTKRSYDVCGLPTYLHVALNIYTLYINTLLPISGLVLDENFLQNASKFVISTKWKSQLWVFVYHIKYGKF